MEHIFEKLKLTWRKSNARRKGPEFGIRISAHGDTLTHLRFADDCMFFAQSRLDAEKMLRAFIAVSKEYGLKVHAGKTRVMTWNHLSRERRTLNLDQAVFTILEETDSERYLGRKLSFYNCHSTELHHRLAAGWSKFHSFRSELTSASYSLRSRLRLFETIVSTTVLFGCSTWALTRSLLHSLDIVRRKMLRYVLRIYPQCLADQGHNQARESWSDYMQRSARIIERNDEKYKLVSWSSTFKARKWSFAGAIVRATDERWSRAILDWVPDGYRCIGRPVVRWCDDIVTYAGEHWIDLAKNAAAWEAHCCGSLMNE